MEITQYLRETGPQKYLLILLPLLAGAAITPYATSRPVQWSSQTTVQLAAAEIDPAPAVVKQLVESYHSVLLSDLTAGPVATKLKLSVDVVAAGTTFAQPQDGEIVTVTYTGSDPATVTKVSEQLARTALAITQQKDLDVANAAVKAFLDQYDKATSALDDYAKKTGVLLPEDDYKQTAADILALQKEIRNFKALGQDTKDREKELAADLAALGPKRDRFLDYQQLQSTAGRAANALASAQAQQTNEEVRRRVTNDPASTVQSVRVDVAKKVSPLPQIVQYILGAAVVGFLLAAVLLVLLEAQARRRRRRRSRRRDAAPVAASTPAEQVQPGALTRS